MTTPLLKTCKRERRDQRNFCTNFHRKAGLGVNFMARKGELMKEER